MLEFLTAPFYLAKAGRLSLPPILVFDELLPVAIPEEMLPRLTRDTVHQRSVLMKDGTSFSYGKLTLTLQQDGDRERLRIYNGATELEACVELIDGIPSLVTLSEFFMPPHARGSADRSQKECIMTLASHLAVFRKVNAR